VVKKVRKVSRGIEGLLVCKDYPDLLVCQEKKVCLVCQDFQVKMESQVLGVILDGTVRQELLDLWEVLDREVHLVTKVVTDYQVLRGLLDHLVLLEMLVSAMISRL
jgi:hypothetical protein